MTTLHAQLVGDKTVLPRAELEHLVELARRSEEIELQLETDEIPTVGIMRLAEEGKAFDWLAEEEDLCSVPPRVGFQERINEVENGASPCNSDQ